MIMFRALVNSSHELNSRDISIIGIQNVHIKASIFKIAVLVYSFYFFLRFGLASGKFQTTASLHCYRVPRVSLVDIYGSSKKRK